MAVYKVPQDVEAEDKLIGPFSFRQFIYLIIVAIAGFLAWVLAQLFLPLLIIPLPVILFFGALALPLRKDQPMETYLAAMVRFFLKPKKRLWKSDGTKDLVEIVAPKAVEGPRGKDLTQADAVSRFNYLAQVMDTRGWSTRGVESATDSLNDVVMEEAATTSDILDENTGFSQALDTRLHEQEAQHRNAAIQQMQAAQAAAQAAAEQQLADTNAQFQAPEPSADTIGQQPTYNPYPTMHQRVLSPEGGAAQSSAPATPVQPTPPAEPQKPVPPAVSPDILKLANNNDLSISALANEAHRLEAKDDDEVVISLR